MPDPALEAKRDPAGRSRGGSPAGRRKILLNASYGPSLLRFRGPLIEELARRGHHVHVSAPDLDRETEAALVALGAAPHPIMMQRAGMNPFADLGYLVKLRALMRRFGPDLVLSYTIKPNIWAGLAARSLGIRSASLVTGLGRLFDHRGGLRARLARQAARLLYRAATDANDVVIFQNPDDLEDFVSGGGSPSAARRGW